MNQKISVSLVLFAFKNLELSLQPHLLILLLNYILKLDFKETILLKEILPFTLRRGSTLK